MVGETIEKTVIRIEADVKKALRDLDRVEEEMKDLDRTTRSTSNGAKASGAIMASAFSAVTVAVTAAAAAMTAFGVYSTKAATDVEQYLVSLGVLYDSQERAGEQLEWIFDFARSTPFEVAGLVDASIKLKAFGLEAQNVLEVLGDTAAATSKPIDQVVNAYGRLNVGDTGQAIAMFRDIGVNLKNIEELEFDARGALVTPIAEAMPLVQQYLEEEFGGLMQAQSETAKGIGSNIKDSMYQAGLAFMGFEVDSAKFREGSLFNGMKDSLQDVLDYVNQIDFSAIGRAFEEGFTLAKNIVGDMARAFEDVDLTSVKNLFLDIAGAVVLAFRIIDKYDVLEHLLKGVGDVLEVLGELHNAMRTAFVGAINLMIDAYNRLVPVMQRVGMEVEEIQRISGDYALSRFFKDAKNAADSAKNSMEGATEAANAAASATTSAKIPDWAGRSDYIRTRLDEIGGKNIDDMLAASGVSSNVGGDQSIESIVSASLDTNSIRAPTVTLIDVTRNGLNTIASKLDTLIEVTGASGSSGSRKRTTGDIMKESAIADKIRVTPRWL